MPLKTVSLFLSSPCPWVLIWKHKREQKVSGRGKLRGREKKLHTVPLPSADSQAWQTWPWEMELSLIWMRDGSLILLGARFYYGFILNFPQMSIPSGLGCSEPLGRRPECEDAGWLEGFPGMLGLWSLPLILCFPAAMRWRSVLYLVHPLEPSVLATHLKWQS